MDIKSLYEKYKQLIPYTIFGVLTTVVNIFVYWLMAHPLGLSTLLSTIIAWIAGVVFAYVTNRKWVFHSNTCGAAQIIKELFSFFLCRLATGIIDWILMWLFVDKLYFDDMLIKTLSNVLVIILNYVASKLLIFRNTSKE